MIPVALVPEPPEFDEKARRPGLTWLERHPDAKRPRDYWSPFKPALADGFGDRCGYAAMYEPVGTVDHHRSFAEAPALAYAWGNYRFVSQWINASKQALSADEILDPHEVGAGWFELDLPSLVLRVAGGIPPDVRARAEYTLDRLHLRDDVRVIRQRRKWLRLYQRDAIDLDGLREVAPLLADAIERQRR